MTERPGGIVHTYLGYDPVRFGSPTQPGPDLVSSAFDHLLAHGSMRRFTPEELANAVRLDPSQIRGLGPSLESLIARLEERKRRLLARYETDTVVRRAAGDAAAAGAGLTPPKELERAFRRALREGQLHDLERLWYAAEKRDRAFAAALPALIEAMGVRFEIDELAARWTFTGREALDVPTALAVKAELERIERLLEQLREALRNARPAIVDLDALSEFVEAGDVDELRELGRRVQELVEELARQQGFESGPDGLRLTPKALRLYQSKVLAEIFGELEASRSGRHAGPVAGEGAVELPRTKAYEFGDSLAHLDPVQSMLNAAARGQNAPGEPLRLRTDDLEIHRTRNNPRCATVVAMDMSGSMRWSGLYVACKRMALALDGLIRREYPGDFLRFLEMYSFARPCAVADIPALMPRPVTIRHPVVRLRADLADDRIGEQDIPPHFTNIQHALRLGRQLLAAQDTPNRQIAVITDGLPTAHFEGSELFLLYPPDPRTEEATLREGALCAREGITINLFLLPTWSQSEEDVRFAHRLAESTGGRVFFAAGSELDRFVLWDYVSRRRRIIG